MEMKSSNPFTATAKYSGREYDTEYIRYYEKECIADAEKFDPKNPDRFLVEKKVVEYERVPIKEFINQFASKVGILNELKGIVSRQQMDEFVESHQAPSGYVDLTKLPDSAFEISQIAAKADAAWDSIPDELKGKMTKEEFLKSLTSDQIKAYVSSVVAKQADEKKEGE